MLRAKHWWLAVVALTVTTIVVVRAPRLAHADEPHDPAIPIRDLPDFPTVKDASGTQVSQVSVYGASLAQEDTVVGAAKREQSLGTVASAVTVLTSDMIRRFGYRSLAEALRSVAGVYVTDDREIERIGVRGVSLLGDENTRILILIDGTPLNEPWAQFVDGSTALPISMDDVARIEVIRGPVSSIYGTNAFVGIINIVTLEADKAPRAYGRTSLDSYGTAAVNAAFNTGDLNHQVRGSVSYQYRNGETVTYPDLMQSTSADGDHALFGSVAVNFDRLFFQVRGYDRSRELPGAPYNSEIGSTDNTNDDRQVTAEVGYTREVATGYTLAARAYADHYAFANHLAYDGATPAFDTHASSTWFGGELRGLADLIKSKKDQRDLLSLTAGANVELTQTSSTASTAPTPIDIDFNIAGVYAEATAEPTKWFAVTAGARFDRNSEFENNTSPRAALFLRKGDDYGLKFLYAQGFRNPSIFEAYYNDGARFLPAVDANGTSSLQPEGISAYELVAYGKPATGVKLRVSAWNWRLDALLLRHQFDAPPPINAPRIQYVNSGTLVSRGVELESSYRDVAGRYAYANLSVSLTGANCIAQNGDSLINNPFLNTSTGNCEARTNAPVLIGKVGASSQMLMNLFYLSAEAQYISPRGTQDMTTTVPSWFGLNLMWYAPKVRGFDLSVGARNLIMREEVPAQSDYNRGSGATTTIVREVPGPGREVFARLGYAF